MHRTLAICWVMLTACHRGAPVRTVDPVVVRPGIDVLLTDSIAVVRGHHVGLVTNQTGVDRRGISDVERLRSAGVDLRALFSPEHGFRGAADPGATVASMRDSATGLPIYSLYGRTVAPTDSMLVGLDLLLIDLQDVGARYYTYLGTAVEVMRSAAKHGIPVVILDRPNPLGGALQGNVLDPAFASFVGRIGVPMRHGLTLGELARLANSDLGLGVHLSVIPVAGWHRRTGYSDTGLPWIPPSPNLKTLEAVAHYPGTCLFEGTNLSVARGTDAAFEQIGAPWLDADAVLTSLNGAARSGVTFEPVSFTPHAPGDAKYADTLVAGIRLHVTDAAHYDPVATSLYLLQAIRSVHRDRFAFIPAHFDRLAGTPTLRHELERDREVTELVQDWKKAVLLFQSRVTQFQIYRD